METGLAWLQLYWGPLLLILITAVLFVVAWQRVPGGNIGGAAAQLLSAAQIAKDLVKGAEQAWVTGSIEKDERYDVVMDHLQRLFPGLSSADLNAIVEAAVYGMNEFKRLPKPTLKAVAVAAEPQSEELREFFWVLRRALYLVLRWIERRYGWKPSTPGEE